MKLGMLAQLKYARCRGQSFYSYLHLTGMQDLAGNALCRLRGRQLLSRRLLSCAVLLCVLPAELLRGVPACHCAQILDNPAATTLKLKRLRRL